MEDETLKSLERTIKTCLFVAFYIYAQACKTRIAGRDCALQFITVGDSWYGSNMVSFSPLRLSDFPRGLNNTILAGYGNGSSTQDSGRKSEGVFHL